jgi:plasmid stabilization system protein ParE
VALAYRIKARAKREIEKAAEWWAENRLAAVRKDVEDALKILVEQPGIGTKVETGRSPQVRRFLLNRTNYFLYYRVRRAELEVLSVWHTSREHGPSV